MTKRLGRRFWSESALACITGVLAVLTAAWPAWIEGIFGVDPDHHNGSLEWILVVACAIATALLVALARREWRRVALAASS
jgi:uncharacterized membrane protein